MDFRLHNQVILSAIRKRHARLTALHIIVGIQNIEHNNRKSKNVALITRRIVQKLKYKTWTNLSVFTLLTHHSPDYRAPVWLVCLFTAGKEKLAYSVSQTEEPYFPSHLSLQQNEQVLEMSEKISD